MPNKEACLCPIRRRSYAHVVNKEACLCPTRLACLCPIRRRACVKQGAGLIIGHRQASFSAIGTLIPECKVYVIYEREGLGFRVLGLGFRV